MTAPTLAMTIRLPYAAAIRAAAYHAGGKTVENRGRRIGDRHIGQRVAVHAAATWDKAGARDPRIRGWWWGATDRGPLEATDFRPHFRRIVAVATITGCHQAVETGQLPWSLLEQPASCCEPWGQLRYLTTHGYVPAWHITLADVVALPEPVGPVKGRLSVPWNLPADVQAQVAAQLETVPS